MRAPWWLWALRGAASLCALWLLVAVGRSWRWQRAAAYRRRPSSAQGLAGLYMPPVSVIVPAPDAAVPPWVGRLSYPRDRLEVLVVVPRGLAARGAPEGARVVPAPGRWYGSLVGAGLRAARREVAVVVPPGLALGPGAVKRLVAPLVDPFVAAAVGRVAAGRPGAGLAGRLDDLDRWARACEQVGRHVVGAPVTAHREPFAVRLSHARDVGGWRDGELLPDTDLLLRLYVRGFAVAYVEEAVALAGPPTWQDLHHEVALRTAGLRRLWKVHRREVRRARVLEGPEKTDVRWVGRGATAPLWLAAGWALDGALRLADTSWAPEAIGGVLLLLTFATPIWFLPYLTLETAALQFRRRSLLALVPWLPLLVLQAIWSGTLAAFAAPVLARRARRSVAPRTARRPR